MGVSVRRLGRYTHTHFFLCALFLCCVSGAVSLGRACPCLSWMSLFRLAPPLHLLSCPPFMVLRGSSLSLLLLGFLFGVVAVSLFALVAWVLAVWPAFSCFPLPSPPRVLVCWFFLVQSVCCWSLPPDIWLYLQRSGCHTFGMACRD